MLRIIASLSFFCGTAFAADVALIGVIGEKAAVFAVDGGEPKAVKVGQKWWRLTVLSVERGQATIEIDGKQRVLKLGHHYRTAGTTDSAGRDRVTLAADTRGMFFSEGAINGLPVRFMVDTGATFVGMSAAQANILGLDFRKGRPVMMQTANGQVVNYLVSLDRVKLGSIELNGVEGVVGEQDMPFVLLGMSFLNRLQMQRDGSSMTLTRRF